MKFHSKPVEEHSDVPLADQGKFEELVEQWLGRRERPSEALELERRRTFVASISQSKDDASRQAQLDEILSLIQAQGDEVVGFCRYRQRRINPKTLISRGIYEDIAERARDANATMVVVDVELSPSQTRNLEEAIAFPICDREAVILNVFLRSARTKKAKIQVEIAQLEFLRPRIRGVGLSMDQQAGGIMGSRGPGETASELFARKLDGRLEELRKAFHRLQRAGKVQRQGRQKASRIALIGYTNAGKTTLMNALAQTKLSAKDRPFETLDATSRCLSRKGSHVILSDTVGFIRRLPKRLLQSFETTLAEAKEASLLAIVVDVSDSEWPLHLRTTDDVLRTLGAEEIPRFYVFNKVDRAPDASVLLAAQNAAKGGPYRMVSAHSREDILALRKDLLSHGRARDVSLLVRMSHAAAGFDAQMYRVAHIVAVGSSDKATFYRVQGPHYVRAWVKRLGGKVLT